MYVDNIPSVEVKEKHTKLKRKKTIISVNNFCVIVT